MPITYTFERDILDIAEGRTVVGPFILKAIQRHRRNLINGHERGLHFDPEAGDYVCRFIEEFCVPPNQETPMKLMPWERVILGITYGWKRADGYRRFSRSYVEISKKQGKTGLVAAIALFHLIADGELSPRVFISATTRKQASICFKEAAAMRLRHPELKSAIHQSGNEPILALYTDDLGRMSMMSRDGASEDGAVCSACVLDELHRWVTNSNLYSVLRYGGRTRKQPLMWETTTAGASADGTSLCYGEREYGVKVLDGFLDDDAFAPWIFCMDPKDDWKDPNNWVKSNPSLGYLLTLDDLKKEYAEAQGKPSALGDFKRFCLNIWSSESADPALDIDQWDECSTENLTTHPDPKRLRQELIASLAGRTCFGGVDLAPKIDTSALVLVSPPLKADDKWAVLEWFWCPADNIADRSKRDRVPYDVWAEDGFIVPTEGNLTDVRYIADQITDLTKQFNLREIYYDDAWSSELIRMLGESGFDMRKLASFPQSHIRMNPSCQELMRMVLRKQLSHANNPVMRWQMNNLRWNTQKGTDFIKPARDRKREKIDGCASLIMAIACATSPDNILKPKKKFFVVTSA